jgi:hypothetical protein
MGLPAAAAATDECLRVNVAMNGSSDCGGEVRCGHVVPRSNVGV